LQARLDIPKGGLQNNSQEPAQALLLDGENQKVIP
jgi:hypothetical protein